MSCACGCRLAPTAFWLAATFAISCLFNLAPVVGQTLIDRTLKRYGVPERDLPEFTEGMLPMRRSDFERLVKSLNQTTLQPIAAARVHIERADFMARFRDGQLEGDGEFVLRPAPTSGVMIRLPPHQLAMKGFRWFADGVFSPVTSGLDAHGDFLLVPKPGSRLSFSWSLRATHREPQRSVFELDLPQSGVTRVLLQTPTGWFPETDDAIVSPIGRLPDADRSFDLTHLLSSDNDDEIWLLELGSKRRIRFELVHRSEVRHAATLRQALSYQITDAGVQLRGTLSLDVWSRIRRLELETDAPLRIASARLGEQRLSMIETSGESVVLEFPEPLTRGRREIEIVSLVPLVLGSPLRLPRLRVANVRWQHGTATLDVPETFELTRIDPTGYVETSLTPLPAPRTGESRVFQAFSEDASLQIELAHRRAQLDVTTALSLRFTDTMITANQVSIVTAGRGELFSLELTSPREWDVSSIEAEPADNLESVRSTGQGVTSHRLRFREPLTAGMAATITLQAHRRLPVAGRELSGDTLRPADWMTVGEKRYVSLLADPPLQLRVFDDDRLRRVTPNLLPDLTRDLLIWSPGSVVYEDRSKFQPFMVQLKAENPKYQARIEVNSTLDGRSLFQHFLIECEPQTGALSEIPIRVAGPPDAQIDWELNGSSDGFTAVREMDVPVADIWKIRLHTPQVDTIKLQGTSRRAFEFGEELSTISVPGASTQTASLMIASADGVAFSVRGGRSLRSIQPAVEAAAETPVGRAHFRYDPNESAHVVVDQAARGSEPAAAWFWRCQVSSRFDQSGDATHRAELTAESLGVERTSIWLPSEATILRAMVNDVEVSLAALSLRRNTVTIPLPAGQRRCTIEMEYATRGPPLGLFSSVRAPWPRLDLPCLRQTWTAWLPPDHHVLKSGDGRGLTVDERLFGARWMRTSGGPFDLFSTEDWRSLLSANPMVAVSAYGEDSISSKSSYLTAPGWTSHHITNPGRTTAGLRTIRRSVVRAAGWSLLFLTAGAVTWPFRGRRRFLAFGIFLTAIVTLLVPDGLVPLARGAFLGFCLGALCLVVRRRVSQLPLPWTRAIRPIQAAAIGTSVWCFICSQATGQMAAGGLEESGHEDARSLVIPVDDNLEPTGEVVYLSPKLYDDLRRSDSSATPQPAWLLKSADYAVTLANQPGTGGIRVAKFTATFQVETFRRRAGVRFPFSQQHLRQLRAFVDGRRASIQWDGQSVEVEIGTMGESRIVFELDTVLVRQGRERGFDLSIPPLPASMLTITTPQALDGVSARGARGAVTQETRSNSSQRISRVQLGTTSNFGVRWADQSARQQPAELDVRRFQWLRVQSNSVVMEVLFRLTVRSGELSDLRMFAEPQMVLQEFDEDQPVSTYSIDDREWQVIDLQLDRVYSAGSGLSIRAQFHMPDASTIGRIRIPDVLLEGTDPVGTWIAVSFPPSLEVTPDSEAELLPVASGELNAAWPGRPELPEMAYQVSGPAADVVLQVRPRRPELVVRQETAVSVGRGYGELHFQARMDAAGGSTLQQQLSVPDDVQITSVRARNDGAGRLLRWSRASSGRMTVFYREPMSGAIDLTVTGVLSVADGAPVTLPRIRFIGGSVERDVTHLFRREDVGLELSSDYTSVFETEFDFKAISGHYVGSISNQGRSTSSTMIARANSPTIRAKMTTEMQYDGKSWQIVAHIEADVSDGVVDRLRLIVPSEWTDELSVSSPFGHELEAIAGSSGTLVSLAAGKPMSGRLEMTVRAQQATALDQSSQSLDFQVPDIALLDVQQVSRFVRLPTAIEDQSLEWDVSGLELQEPSARTSNLYRVLGESMQATLVDIVPNSGQAQVHLADYSVSLHGDATCFGTAGFDLEPGHQRFCQLRIPDGLRLIQATVAGLPAVNDSPEQQVWQLRLRSDKLPQRVEVLFAGQIADDRSTLGDRLIVGPTLIGLPVKRTVWTIAGSRRGNPWEPLLRHTIVDRSRWTDLRRQAIDDLFVRAQADFAARIAASEYDAWSQRWNARRQQFERQRTIDSGSNNEVREHSVADQAWSVEAVGGPQAIVFDRVYCAIEGDANAIIVQRSRSLPKNLAGMVQFGLLSIVGGSLVFASWKISAFRQWLSRWPHAVGVILGLVIWFVLTPGFLGWMLVLLFSVAAIRPIASHSFT